MRDNRTVHKLARSNPEQILQVPQQRPMKPRGILPTYVSDQEVLLCKAALTIRNSYEIRLALYMGLQTGRTFVLAISPEATVDEALAEHVLQHGGKIVRRPIGDHSVYVGAFDHNGDELDGWVVGHNDAWAAILAEVRSAWLKDRLRVGGIIPSAELLKFREAIGTETIHATNIDDEDIQEALLRLTNEAEHVDGSIFVQ